MATSSPGGCGVQSLRPNANESRAASDEAVPKNEVKKKKKKYRMEVKQYGRLVREI